MNKITIDDIHWCVYFSKCINYPKWCVSCNRNAYPKNDHYKRDGIE